MVNAEEIYAIIVACIILVAAVICCVGVRFFRKSDEPFSRSPNDVEWQRFQTQLPMSPTDDDARRVLDWQVKYPPNTTEFVDSAQSPLVLERGVNAWTFIENERQDDIEGEPNSVVVDKTTLVFCPGEGCLLTNLPLPPHQELVYWEVKIEQLSTSEDHIAIGLATKPYPTWRLPGLFKHSVAYHSNTGAVHSSDRPQGRPYGPRYEKGDVIGVGYLNTSATVFFTRNGTNVGKASIGFKFPVYPAIGSKGQCRLSVNFGQSDFLFSPANTRHAALAPKQGTLPPPPAYGGHVRDTFLFGSSDRSFDTMELTYPSPSSSAAPPQYA